MRGFLVAAAVVGISCGRSEWAAIDVDCGTATEPLSPYEAAGRDCLWNAYSTGRSAKWVVTRRTLEGDPIPKTLLVSPSAIEASQDNREDKFGGPDRGIVTWRCESIAKRSVSSDNSRFDFYLSGCTGPSASTTFP